MAEKSMAEVLREIHQRLSVAIQDQEEVTCELQQILARLSDWGAEKTTTEPTQKK